MQGTTVQISARRQSSRKYIYLIFIDLFQVEEPEQQSITLKRLKILLANMGISLNLLSLSEAEKILQDPAILLHG